MLLTLNKYFMRFSIDFIIYINLFQSNKNDLNRVVFIQDLL